MFRRLLGALAPVGSDERAGVQEASRDSDRGETPSSVAGETAAVRRIVARLEALPPGRGRFLAAFAYVLGRAAHADLDISAEETTQIEAALVEHGGLDEAQAVLIAEMAKLEARGHGATQDFLVTRELSELATLEEKLALLRCCFLVGAADASISAEEASVINQIARELDVPPALLNGVRADFVERLSAIQAMRRLSQER